MPTRKKKTRPPQMDPIFPIEAGYEIPPLGHGEGAELMKDESPIVVVMPYRAFYFMWEHAERSAAKNYPHYVGGPMDHAAQTFLDAVVAFRSAAAGKDIRRFPEAKAQRAREIWASIRAREAKAAKQRPVGDPPEASESPSKSRSTTRRRRAASKKSSAS